MLLVDEAKTLFELWINFLINFQCQPQSGPLSEPVNNWARGQTENCFVIIFAIHFDLPNSTK